MGTPHVRTPRVFNTPAFLPDIDPAFEPPSPPTADCYIHWKKNRVPAASPRVLLQSSSFIIRDLDAVFQSLAPPTAELYEKT